MSVICFGEMLWDVFPDGQRPGGAPFNVAAHLVQLGMPTAMVSAVGEDTLGNALLEVARVYGVDTRYVHRHPTLPTGTVEVALADGEPSYRIAEPAAWDAIPVNRAIRARAGRSAAVIYGSLAARSAENEGALLDLLEPGPLRVFDVNLRAPFDDLDRVRRLAASADLVKLNREEAGRVSELPVDKPEQLGAAAAHIAEKSGAKRVCITLGAEGAVLWDQGDRDPGHRPRR